MNMPDHELLRDWLEMWEQGVVHIGDVAEVFERVITETGDANIFANAPQSLKNEITSDINRFKVTGTKTVWIKGTGAELDLTHQMRRLTEILAKAGFIQ